MMTLDNEIDKLILRFSRCLRKYIDTRGNTAEAAKVLIVQIRQICIEIEALLPNTTREEIYAMLQNSTEFEAPAEPDNDREMRNIRDLMDKLGK